MPVMDDKPVDALVSELEECDPAEAPALAGDIADALGAALSVGDEVADPPQA